MVSGLNDMFPGNGVQRGLRCFLISSNMYMNHAVLKRQLAQWVQVKSFTNVSAARYTRYTQQLKILEDMIVIRVL